MNRLALSLVLAACSLCALPALAADGPWNHNGSVVYMSDGSDFYPNQLKIWYTDPRDGMRAEGVRNGTVLFRGLEYEDGTVEGVAYVFKSGCSPAGYNVSGTFDEYSEYLVLAGQRSHLEWLQGRGLQRQQELDPRV